MKTQIVWNQPSTIRGLVWALTGILAVIGYFIGKDPIPVIGIGSAVSGALGVALHDNQSK